MRRFPLALLSLLLLLQLQAQSVSSHFSMYEYYAWHGPWQDSSPLPDVHGQLVREAKMIRLLPKQIFQEIEYQEIWVSRGTPHPNPGRLPTVRFGGWYKSGGEVVEGNTRDVLVFGESGGLMGIHSGTPLHFRRHGSCADSDEQCFHQTRDSILISFFDAWVQKALHVPK